ncbi:MAG: hypothetical protein E4G92_02990 [Bacteroidia bacterium]|nr:MAG: hypothetical protein E4G92_02990 [Bacteroidia bacterium]
MKTLIATLFLSACILNGFSQPRDKVAKTPALNYDWSKGIINITELSGGIGLADTQSQYSKQYFGITNVTGYQFSRNIKAGVGVGLQVHNGGTLFPLYLDARYSFSAQEIVPFIAGAGGLALSFRDITNESRIFINPSVGVKWVAANKTAVSFSTGVIMMSGDYYRSSFVNFKLGIEFKGIK